MAGLLDFILGGTTYGQNKREDAQSKRAGDAYRGLLGTAPHQVTRKPGGSHPGLVSPGELQPQYQTMQGGAGYLGGEMTAEEMDQRLQGKMMDIYGGADMAQNIQDQTMRGRQAMQRQKQEQRYYAGNMSQAQQQQQQIAHDNMIEGYQTKFNAETQAYQGSIRGATGMDNLFENDNYNISGPGQLDALMKFMKAANDGGSFMSDDMMNSAQSAGFKGQIKDFATWFTTDGFKDSDFLRDMHMIMRKQATADAQRIEEQRSSLMEARPDLRPFSRQIFRGAGHTYVAPTSIEWGN